MVLIIDDFKQDNQRKRDDMSNSRYTDSDYHQINPDGNGVVVIYKPYDDQRVEEGGYGAVFKAQKISSDGHLSDVALKLFIDPEDGKPMKEGSRALGQETKGNIAIYEKKHRSEMDCVAKPLAPKPFCVKSNTGIEYFAMDYSPWIEEGTLEKLIKKWNEKSETPEERIQRACFIIELMLDRFIGLHNLEIVHRDIHVGNLAYNENSKKFWVFDYSLTRFEPLLPELGQSSTGGVPIGVYGRARDWLRVRQKDGKQPIVTPQQSDLYAIGNVAHSLLANESWPGLPDELRPGKNNVERPMDRIDRLMRLGVPVHLSWWVAKMTSLHINDLPRPKSCKEALMLFREAKSGRISPEFIPTTEEMQKWLDIQIIEHGSTTKRGLSLMHLATKEGREDVLFYLVLRGNDANAKDNEGNTPLFEAAAIGHETLIDWLVKYGADVNAKNIVGRTALHVAANRNKLDCAMRLKANGADINAKDNQGFTPYRIAETYGVRRIMAYLEGEGADIISKNDDN